jgi:DNA helicase IV
VSVREGDAVPRVVRAAGPAALADVVVAETRALAASVADGNAAVVCPDDMAEEVSRALDAAGLAHGRAGASALDAPLTVVPVGLVKGLELDGVLVVEPARIAAASPRGLRSLYVALTRSTRRLTVVHAAPLPEPLLD